MIDKTFLETYVRQNGMPNRPRPVLAEYLQSEILDAVYTSKFGRSLSFMGGTALRFVHRINRFSEDLDFEQIREGLDVEELSRFLEKRLHRLGFEVETRVKTTENIIIIFVKFSGTSPLLGEDVQSNQKFKVKIEIDPNPSKHIQYEAVPVSAFGKNMTLIANTPETIFAQKIIALAFRPYQKGRDFYDIAWFLIRRTIEPKYELLREKDIIASHRSEVAAFLSSCMERADLEQTARDVERFLFRPEDSKWILDLPKRIEEWEKQ